MNPTKIKWVARATVCLLVALELCFIMIIAPGHPDNEIGRVGQAVVLILSCACTLVAVRMVVQSMGKTLLQLSQPARETIPTASLGTRVSATTADGHYETVEGLWLPYSPTQGECVWVSGGRGVVRVMIGSVKVLSS